MTKAFLIVLVGFAFGCGRKVAEPKEPNFGAVRAAISFARAQEAASDQNWTESLKHSERALQDDPAHIAARMSAAWACWNLGQYEKAGAFYDKVTGSLSINGRLWKAHSLAAAGNWSASQQAYADLFASADASFHWPVSSILWAPVALPGSDGTDNADRTVVYWKKVSRENPKTVVPAWLSANALIAAGRAGDAAEIFGGALNIKEPWAPLILSYAMVSVAKGKPDVAEKILTEVLTVEPNHVSALWGRVTARGKKGDHSEAFEDMKQLMTLLGRHSPPHLLCDGADMAWSFGRTNEEIAGIEFLNTYTRYATNAVRAVMLGSDTNALVLAAFDRNEDPGPKSGALSRYVLASAIFGCVNTLISADWTLLSMEYAEAAEILERVNKPTAADVEVYAKHAKSTLEQAMKALDFRSGVQLTKSTAYLPHLGRCVRELEAALKARPGFDAAKVLLANVHHLAGRKDQARTLLKEVLRATPDATSVRLLLSEWVPLDQAQELLSEVRPEDDKMLSVMFRRAQVEFEAGDAKASASASLAALREHGAYWDVYELLGIALSATGDHDSALVCLEYSNQIARTPRGALILAKLRERLAKPEVTEALIDAWRSAAGGSAEETEARELLRKRDTAKFVCGRCSGGGTISITGGTAGGRLPGVISTSQAICPQCQGLGLWHTKVR